MHVRLTTDRAVEDILPAHEPQGAVQPRANQMFAICKYYIKANVGIGIQVETPFHDLLKCVSRSVQQITLGMMLPARKNIPEDVLAIRSAVNLAPV